MRTAAITKQEYPQIALAVLKSMVRISAFARKGKKGPDPKSGPSIHFQLPKELTQLPASSSFTP